MSATYYLIQFGIDRTRPEESNCYALILMGVPVSPGPLGLYPPIPDGEEIALASYVKQPGEPLRCLRVHPLQDFPPDIWERSRGTITCGVSYHNVCKLIAGVTPEVIALRNQQYQTYVKEISRVE